MGRLSKAKLAARNRAAKSRAETSPMDFPILTSDITPTMVSIKKGPDRSQKAVSVQPLSKRAPKYPKIAEAQRARRERERSQSMHTTSIAATENVSASKGPESERICRLISHDGEKSFKIVKRKLSPISRDPAEISCIVSARLMTSLRYTVKWIDGSITEEPWQNLIPGSEEAILDFHRARPEAPRPRPRLQRILISFTESQEASFERDDKFLLRPSPPNSETQRELESLRTKCAALNEENDALQAAKVKKAETINDLRAQLRDLETQSSTDARTISNFRARIQELETQNSRTVFNPETPVQTQDLRTITTLQARVERLQAQGSNDVNYIEDLKARLQDLSEQKANNSSTITEQRSHIQRLMTQRKEDVATIDRLRARITNLVQDVLSAERAKHAEENRLLRVRAKECEAQSLRLQQEMRTGGVSALRSQVQSLEAENEKLKEDLARIQNSMVSWGYFDGPSVVVDE